MQARCSKSLRFLAYQRRYARERLKITRESAQRSTVYNRTRPVGTADQSLARVLVMLEQFAGVAYIAVVVSRLVGLTIVSRDRRTDLEHPHHARGDSMGSLRLDRQCWCTGQQLNLTVLNS
jgi:hypothetical protein